MIVWGGWDGGNGGNNYFNTGGRYTPGTDSWTTLNTANAPTGRYLHTAIWTGTEMIVWGGFDNIAPNANTGGKYNAVSNSWAATNDADAPEGRSSHTAVWTDNEMIIWGGENFSGYQDSWRKIPVSYRQLDCH